MTEAQAKKHLLEMLRSLTAGSVLHLLAESFGESANRAGHRRDEAAERRSLEVASTLFVVGLGIDAACPR